MASQGEWLTPYFMDRYALYKPPLLYWLSGASAAVFGVDALSVRLPSVFAGAALATIVFLWALRGGSMPAAFACVVLLWADPLYHRLGRLNLTDMLLAVLVFGAVMVLSTDPTLSRRRSLLAFSILTGAAIMTKSVAGLLPLLTIAFHGTRPGWKRALQACGIIALVAAPWHLYQLAVHPVWFWNEFVRSEHIAYGLSPSPPQTSAENHVWFYVRRLFLLNGVLVAAAIIGVRRSVDRRLILAFFGSAVLAVLAFRYRNVSYLLPLVPMLAVAAAPVLRNRAAVGLAIGLFVVRVLAPSEPWGLPFGSDAPIPSARILRNYCEARRGNELIIVSSDDEFYASVLPLARVRYVFIDPTSDKPAYGMDFRHLGITLTVDEFLAPETHMPKLAQRLSEFGLHSEKPVGTAILARDAQDVARLVKARPDADFLMPASSGTRLWLSHQNVAAPPRRYGCF